MTAKEKLLQVSDELIKFAKELDRKYPELQNHYKPGDKGVFWDDNHKLIDNCVIVGSLKKVEKGDDGKTYYFSGPNCYFDNFKKFETLNEIVKEFEL